MFNIRKNLGVMPLEEAKKLFENGDLDSLHECARAGHLHSEIALRKDIHEKTIEILSRSDDEKVRLRLVYCKNITPAILITLAEMDPRNEYQLHDIARHALCPVSLLDELSEHRNPLVRDGVAQNPNTPKYIMNKFKNDRAPLLKAEIAERDARRKHDAGCALKRGK